MAPPLKTVVGLDWFSQQLVIRSAGNYPLVFISMAAG
jgi:hypothetical protein